MTARKGGNAHLLVGADELALVFLHAIGHIIYIGVEADGHGAVFRHLDEDGVGQQAVGMAPAGQVVALVGYGQDGDNAVRHHDIGAIGGVGGDVHLSGNGVDNTHHAVGRKGQAVGVVQEVALDLHVAVNKDGSRRLGREDDAVDSHAVNAGHLGPVHKVVAGLRRGREAQLRVGKHGVVVPGDVVAHAVGQGGSAGE